MHHLVWNVDPAIVSFGPFTVRWYGLLFALGFLVGFQVMAQIYRAEQRPLENLSSLLSYVMLGTIIGARLGHVLFYQPDYYFARPWEVPMVWLGGLASHSGFAGVIIALYLPVRFSDRKKRCSVTTAISVTRTAVAGVRGSAEDDDGP